MAFLIAWSITMFLLTVGTIRLPWAYTIDVGLVDLALIVLAIANNNGSTGMTKLGGVIVFVFAALGAYIWLSAADASLGGPGYPLGRPVIRRRYAHADTIAHQLLTEGRRWPRSSDSTRKLVAGWRRGSTSWPTPSR